MPLIDTSMVFLPAKRAITVVCCDPTTATSTFQTIFFPLPDLLTVTVGVAVNPSNELTSLDICAAKNFVA